ncbi:MAG TPA: TIGR04190 family B12-binding domain/radical SAM domain protein [Anaerolineaceae bacterium]|nr:TIGR04190 family B12-binding domain/radical SAM domain protein [Anaerolineaceae bacterium]
MSTPDLIFLHAPSVYDFRREAILYGPVSDLVPSTPVFEMYPIGFTTMAEYLERHGLQTRIVNLAVRMLEDPRFDVERHISHLNAAAFGIDLHWLPHAHGSIEVAKIVKRFHPDCPVIFGGFSSTYFHAELIRYPAVDFVMRGDSTEIPMLALVQYIRSGGSAHPQPNSVEAGLLASIPNLVWKDADGNTIVNPITYSPENLDGILLDYSHVLKAVVRHRDLANYIPFRNWMRYPITAALSVRGCRYNCVTCGGGACAYRNLHNRRNPAFRNPEDLARDIRRIGEFSRGPVFVLGDIRQAGDEYADRFLTAISGYKKPVFIELFDAPPTGFFKKVARALPNFTVEISMESHDEAVRRAFGRPYTNQAAERAIDEALDAGCQRLDLFFMVGLKEQTYQSVMGTVEYSRRLLRKYAAAGDKRLIPFISPLAPFLDPGSRAFEEPEKHGYRLFCRTLEEHRQALLAPSWKYVLNYETRWLSRDDIVSATYESGRQLNLLKGEYGIIDAGLCNQTDRRIAQAISLISEIDEVMSIPDAAARQTRILELKHRVDNSNLSTVCDKGELEISFRGPRINFIQAAGLVAQGWWHDLARHIQRRESGV